MKLEERKSSSYWKRKQLMEDLTVPTISETKEQLGAQLGEIILQQSNECQKEDLGLEPSLRGPIGELWMSPSDLLIGKVCLKPPLTQKHIQALTHEGILDIGSSIEKKFWNEMEVQKQLALEELEGRLKRIFEIEKHRLLTETVSGERTKHAKEMLEMRTQFENKINQLVRECYNTVMDLMEENKKNIEQLNELWEERLDKEVMNTVQRLTEEFMEKMRIQEKLLVDIFTKQIRYVKDKYRCSLEFEKIKCKELVVQVQHHLHCQNIANLMYVLCKERKKCKGEKDAMEQYYENKIIKNNTEIKSKVNTIRRLRAVIRKKKEQLSVREKILIEILRQFQKFIYYALKASPTQGEFLLNINKLIKFELDDYCIQAKKKVSMPAMKKEKSVKEEIPVMEVCDYLDFTTFLATEDSEEYHQSDALPAFYFDEKMYVREDFRDMFSAGIKIDKQHPLWNDDVEELMNVFKDVVEDERSISSVNKFHSQHSNIHFLQEHAATDTVQSTSLAKIKEDAPEMSNLIITKPSIVSSNRKAPSVETEEKELRRVSLGFKDTLEKVSSRSDAKKNRASTTMSLKERVSQTIGPQEKIVGTTSKLTLARDSVILHIAASEKKSLQNMSRTGLIEKQSLVPDNSVEFNKDMRLQISTEDVEIRRTSFTSESDEEGGSECGGSITSLGKKSSTSRPTSKLLLAQDSIELIKSQMGLFEKKTGKDESTHNILETTESPKNDSQSTKTPPSTPKHKTGAKMVKNKQKVTKCQRRVAKVVGSTKTKEHDITSGEFTKERITSLVNLMKENPSLIRLFTACSK